MDTVILDGYWKALGNYPIDLLSKALDNLATEENSFMPDAGKIIAEIKAIRGSDRAKQTVVPAYCEACNNTGMVVVRKIHDNKPYDTVYACRCINGQRIDQRIRPVPESLILPCDGPQKKLPMVTLESLSDMDSNHVWEDGVDVAKLCDECRKPYVIRHDRRVSAGELQDTHIHSGRPPQCELCFREMGRRAGMWI